MKKISFLFLLLVTSSAYGKEYTDVLVTSLIIEPETNYIEFTINKEPNQIFSTKSYKGKQQDYVVSMIISAFQTQTNIAYVRAKDKSKDRNKDVYVLKSMKFGETTYNGANLKLQDY